MHAPRPSNARANSETMPNNACDHAAATTHTLSHTAVSTHAPTNLEFAQPRRAIHRDHGRAKARHAPRPIATMAILTTVVTATTDTTATTTDAATQTMTIAQAVKAMIAARNTADATVTHS